MPQQVLLKIQLIMSTRKLRALAGRKKFVGLSRPIANYIYIYTHIHCILKCWNETTADPFLFLFTLRSKLFKSELPPAM